MNRIYFARIFFLVSTVALTLIPIIRLNNEDYATYFLILLPYNFLGQILCSLSLSVFYNLETKNDQIIGVSAIKKSSIPHKIVYLIATIFFSFLFFQYLIGVYEAFDLAHIVLSIFFVLFSIFTVKPYVFVYLLESNQLKLSKSFFLLPSLGFVFMLIVPGDLYSIIAASFFSVLMIWTSIVINEKKKWMKYIPIEKESKFSLSIPPFSSILLDYLIFPIWAMNSSENFREVKFLYSNIKFLFRVNIHSFEKLLVSNSIIYFLPIIIISFLSTVLFVGKTYWNIELFFVAIMLVLSVWYFKMDEINRKIGGFSYFLIVILLAYVLYK